MRYTLMLAVAVAVTSCGGDDTDDMTGLDPAGMVAAGIVDAPATSGPRVIRFEFGYGLILTDPDLGIEVTYGFDPVALCDGTATFDVVSIMQVNGPQGRAHAVVQGDDLQTRVWPFASESFDCDLFTSATPIASGVSDLVATDNDVVGGNPDARHVNSLGYRARGVLTLADGRPTRYSGTTHCVWDGTDPATLKCTEKIHLVHR